MGLMVLADIEAFCFAIWRVLLCEGDEGKHLAPSRAVVELCLAKRSVAVRDGMLFAIGEDLGGDGPKNVVAVIGIKDEGYGVWRQVRVRQGGCTDDGRLEALESRLAFLGLQLPR